MSRKKQNYLDYVPGRNPRFPSTEREDSLITITVIRRGIFDKIAQAFFHAPAQSHIDLDKYGSFVWKQIDGQRTLYEIGRLISAEFGTEAEPLYPRLVRFFAILKDCRFILWVKREESAPLRQKQTGPMA